MINLFKSTNQQKIIKEIHNEFDTAQDKLLEQARSIISSTTISHKGERLSALGFINTEPAKSYEANKQILVKTKSQADIIMHYKQSYPFLKFITEDELERICNKYSLVFASVERYNKDVPDKNIKEIETAPPLLSCDKAEDKIYCTLTKDGGFSWVNADGSGWCGIWGKQWYRIPKRIDGQHFSSQYHANAYLQSKLGFTSTYLVSSVQNYIEDRQGLFIAAPPSHFNLDGLQKSKSGYFNFSFTEVKDPIVFRYCRGGVQVLSKWGLEASDELLVNEINN